MERFLAIEESDKVVMKYHQDGVQHEQYKENFNCVDIMDKEFYKGCSHFKILNWRSKMLLCIMDIILINSWTIAHEMGFKGTYRQFKKLLVVKSLNIKDPSVLELLNNQIDISDWWPQKKDDGKK